MSNELKQPEESPSVDEAKQPVIHINTSDYDGLEVVKDNALKRVLNQLPPSFDLLALIGLICFLVSRKVTSEFVLVPIALAILWIVYRQRQM